MAVVLYQGAQVPALRAAAGRDRRLRRGLAGAAGRPPARRSRRQRRRRAGRQPGTQFSTAIVAKAKRERDDRVPARRTARTRPSCPDGQGKYELGDIGIQPIVHPRGPGAQPGSAGRRGRSPSGDVILAVDGERRTCSRERLIATIKAAAKQAAPAHRRARRRRADVTVTPRKIGDMVMIGAQLQPLETRTSSRVRSRRSN